MATYLPLKPGCTFHPFYNGTAVRDYIVRAPDQRQFRISPSAYEILKELDQGTSLEQIHHSIGGEKTVSFSEFHQLFVTQYQGILLCATEAQQECPSVRRRTRFLLHHTLIPGPIVARISGILASAYRPFLAVVFISFIAIAHFILYARWVPGRAMQFHISLVLLATFGSVLIHEFGHSSAVTRFGGKPGSIGVGLYILLPVLYADVSQVWMFRQRHRVAVDLGGVYFQQVVFAVLAFAAVLTHDPSLRTACISIDVMTMVALNPVFRFDGYWVLVDWLGVPNLHQKAREYLKQVVRSVAKLRWEYPRHAALDQNSFKTVIFVLYSVTGSFLMVFLVALNVRWVQTTVTGLVKHAPAMWVQVQVAIGHHQVLKAIDLLTGLVFLFTSGLTVIYALWLRGREMLHRVPGQSR